jgi:transcriptional regulator with XRE-family HTH domain
MDIQSIKKYMKQKKITYDELAQRSGLSISTIKKIFSGISQYPRIDTMQAIERALGITMDETQKSPQDELSEGEKMLLDLFNRVPDDKQELVLQMIQVALKSQE